MESISAVVYNISSRLTTLMGFFHSLNYLERLHSRVTALSDSNLGPYATGAIVQALKTAGFSDYDVEAVKKRLQFDFTQLKDLHYDYKKDAEDFVEALSADAKILVDFSNNVNKILSCHATMVQATTKAAEAYEALEKQLGNTENDKPGD